MTLYARGYRPYEGPRDATRFAFLPIQREGARRAMQGRAFRVFFLISVIALLVFIVQSYLGQTFGEQRRAFRNVPGLRIDAEAAAAVLLRANLETLQTFLSWIAQILVLFVGAGLVADDLKARALPLYLVRPVRPFDYWLGKFLVPVRALALTLLAPGLLLVLAVALFQPSDRMLPFLWARRDLVVAVLVHFAYVAAVWSSVALLASTVAQARVMAIVLGAAVFFGGAVVGLIAVEAGPRVRDELEAVSLYGDAQAVLAHALRDAENVSDSLPPLNYAIVLGLLVTALATFVVLRRARSVEVVS
jgi:hypothetical protein